MSRGIVIAIVGAGYIGHTVMVYSGGILHECVVDENSEIVLPTRSNTFLDIPELEIFETKFLAEFDEHQTFPLDKGEKGIAYAVTAFRDIPLVIPIRA